MFLMRGAFLQWQESWGTLIAIGLVISTMRLRAEVQTWGGLTLYARDGKEEKKATLQIPSQWSSASERLQAKGTVQVHIS